MINTRSARQEVIQQLQEGLRQTPEAGASFAEHLNQVLDSAAGKLRSSGPISAEAHADLDAFVQSLRPQVNASSKEYKHRLAKTILKAYGGDVHRSLAASFDFVLKAAVSYDPTLEALRPPAPLAAALSPPNSYQDLLGLQAKTHPKALLDRFFGDTFQIPS